MADRLEHLLLQIERDLMAKRHDVAVTNFAHALYLAHRGSRTSTATGRRVSRREDVENSIWGDPGFNALSPAGKLVYLWSFTNPRCNMAGIYKVATTLVCAETGLTDLRVGGAFTELREGRLVFYDGCVLWVRSRVKHLRSHHDNIATSIVKAVESFSSHPFYEGFWSEYSHHDWLTSAKARIPHV